MDCQNFDGCFPAGLFLYEQCGNMAREGLRVLVVSKKSLTEEQYQDFEVRGGGSFGGGGGGGVGRSPLHTGVLM